MGCCDTPGLMPIDTAISNMLESITPISLVIDLPLDKAVGHVLSENIHSPINVPPFDNSAMDGYALRSSDLEATTQLPLAGKSFAGIPFEGYWPQGTCIRIMTGAQIPQGCDLVIMQEQAEVNGDLVDFTPALPVKPQQNIRPTGDDIEQGALVLPKGHKLTSRDIPMIATLGIPSVSVFQQPKVAFSQPVTN